MMAACHPRQFEPEAFNQVSHVPERDISQGPLGKPLEQSSPVHADFFGELNSDNQPRIVLFAFQGSEISKNAQHPKSPWLLTAGTQSVRAVLTLAALSWCLILPGPP